MEIKMRGLFTQEERAVVQAKEKQTFVRVWFWQKKKSFLIDNHNIAKKGLKQQKRVTQPRGLRQLNVLP